MRIIETCNRHQISTAATAVLAGILLIILGASCSSEKATEEQNVPTSTAITIQVTQAPTATNTPPTQETAPTAAPLVRLSPDEQRLAELHKIWTDARVNLDAEHFHDSCDPELAATDTRTHEEIIDGWTVALNSGGIETNEWNTGTPSMQIMGGGTTAIVTFVVLRNDEEKFQWANFYTKHDENWYQDCSFD
jgi:hypothetical protein